jgi:hypothetical protein
MTLVVLDTAVDGSELYCYNIEGDRLDVTLTYKFIMEEVTS